jgi:Tat protein translocase TatB subunit
MAFLFILDSLGNSELILILVVALILVGPRKLPQISRQIGKSLAEFRKASEDFKRTWEREVAIETTQPEPEPNRSIMPDNSIIETTVKRSQAIQSATIIGESTAGVDRSPEPGAITGVTSDSAPAAANESARLEPTRKRDWL